MDKETFALSEELRSKIISAVQEECGEMVEQLRKVVRINSINPLHDEGKLPQAENGETKVSRALSTYMQQAGMEIDLFAAKERRENCVGILRGAGDGRSLMFNGHVDVVGVGSLEDWKVAEPFSGDVVDGRVYGRGSTDCKGGLVCAIAAANALKRCGVKLKGDVIIEAVCGEEQMDTEAGTGACIKRGYTADAGIVVEASAPPYTMAVLPASPGEVVFQLTFAGKAAHTGMRHEICRAGGAGDAFAVSAMDKAIYIYNGLLKLEQEWGFTKTHPVFTKPGHFTINPGTINAGPTPWAIPETATMVYTAWFPPQDSVEQIKKELSDYIHLLCQIDTWLKEHPPVIEWIASWPPYNVDANADICKMLCKAYTMATDEEARIYGFAAVADASFLNEAGIPTVIMGPGDIRNVHCADEFVSIAELETAAKTYALAMAAWCGTDQ